MSYKEEKFRKSQQVEQPVKSPEIDYSKIPFKEKRSTGERVENNAFYMPKAGDDSMWYDGYDAADFFGLETERIIPLTPEEKRAVDWGYEEEEK